MIKTVVKNAPGFTKPERIKKGFERCWACGRIVPVYNHVRQNVVTGKAVTEIFFKRHIDRKLKDFAAVGFTVTSVWCIKSNTFAR
jgi:hypothetical protein